MDYSQPAVSVVLPVFNGEHFLAAALESLSAQTLAAFEVVAIDDGSTDATPDVLRHHADRDPRLRIVTQSRGGGAVARNRGIAEARAPLVALMDADDVCLPDRLRRQADRFAAEPGLTVLGSAAGVIDEHGTLTAFDSLPTDHDRIAADLERGFSLYHPSVMVRRDAVLAVGGYRHSLTTAVDYDLWLRMLPRRFANIADGLILYRHHGEQITSRRATLNRFEARVVRAAHRVRQQGRPDPLQGRDGPLGLDVMDALELTPAEQLSLCAELLAAGGDALEGFEEHGVTRSALRDRALVLARGGFDGAEVVDHAQVLRATGRFMVARERRRAVAYLAAVVRASPRQVSAVGLRWAARRVSSRVRARRHTI